MKKSNLYFAVIVVLLVLTGIYGRTLAHTERVPMETKLSQVPERIGAWRGEFVAFAPEMIEKLGADDVLSRAYRDPEGKTLWLYIGYYRSQKSGAQIHSPLHCYPGSGWSPVLHEVVPIRLQDTVMHINKLLIQRGTEERMVAYWYQSQDKVIASELLQRLNLIMTAFQKHRTDGSLVRVSMVIHDNTPDRDWETMVSFIQEIYPQVMTYLPR